MSPNKRGMFTSPVVLSEYDVAKFFVLFKHDTNNLNIISKLLNTAAHMKIRKTIIMIISPYTIN